jgi:hypothetical protein
VQTFERGRLSASLCSYTTWPGQCTTHLVLRSAPALTALHYLHGATTISPCFHCDSPTGTEPRAAPVFCSDLAPPRPAAWCSASLPGPAQQRHTAQSLNALQDESYSETAVKLKFDLHGCRPDHSEDPGVEARTILKWVLRRQHVKVWIRVIWLRSGNGDGLL